MQCENSKCKKKIVNTYSCNKCTAKFCCNSCMIDHYFDVHQNNSEEKIVGPKFSTGITIANLKKLKNTVVSSFIKKGEFLMQVQYDSYFKFENFEKVKIGKKTHVLGAGAFGDVYLIKNKTDGKFFAVKQMDKQRILSTGATLDIVRREIDIHSRLMHENIIRLFSYHEDSQSFYLILEYANSGTLFNSIKKNRGFDEKRGFKYFIQSSAAIYFLHENKLIHRDIKPENLLLDDKDNIKLCDFGWCIELEIGNRNTFCGTIEYMAPEIIKEMPYDRSIDVWSLGILLYELLHGYSPFRAKNSEEDEGYTEVFNNIIKYKFKIEKKELSENCKDLITKLLTPKINSRLKVKDIFAHPWVAGFEENCDIAEEIANQEIKQGKEGKVDVILIKDSDQPKSEIPKQQKEKLKFDTQSNNKEAKCSSANDMGNVYVKKRKPSVQLAQLEEDREKIQETLNSQKQNSVQMAIKSTTDFSYLENNNKSESLFDIVLTQVQEKNKDKRKKHRFLDDSFDKMEKTIENENKIVLKIQKDKSVDKDKSDLTKNTKDFKMLKEINEMESDLNKQIDEQNKRHDSIKNKKDDLHRMLENTNKDFNKLQVQNKLITEIEDENCNPQISTENTKSNSKKNSVNSNNLINLHPKYLPKVIKEDIKDEAKVQSGLPPKDRSLERKEKKKLINAASKSNYNDLIYGSNENSQRGRESHKAQKNSVTGKQIAEKLDLNKELDMSFLPKELLYNDNSFDGSNRNLLSAIELLEKAQENKIEIDKDNKEDQSFWNKVGSFLNPFKCG